MEQETIEYIRFKEPTDFEAKGHIVGKFIPPYRVLAIAADENTTIEYKGGTTYKVTKTVGTETKFKMYHDVFEAGGNILPYNPKIN